MAVKRFFKAYSYEEWQEILADWVEYGLSKVSICEATGAEIIQYELLESLLEAVYLIGLQDEQTYCQERRLKTTTESKAIIMPLIAALDPTLIFEVSRPASSPPNHTSYSDLLIVLADDNHKPFKELEPVIQLVTAGKEKLCCSLHKLSGCNSRLQKAVCIIRLFVSRKMSYISGLRQHCQKPQAKQCSKFYISQNRNSKQAWPKPKTSMMVHGITARRANLHWRCSCCSRLQN